MKPSRKLWRHSTLPIDRWTNLTARDTNAPLRSRLPRNFYLEIGWKLLYWGEFVAQSGLKTRPTSRPESFFEFLTRSQSGRSLCNYTLVQSRDRKGAFQALFLHTSGV